MSDPTTAETPTMLDSLADEAKQTWINSSHVDVWPKVIEAVLTRMLEPSEGMIEAACPSHIYETVGQEGEDVCKFIAGWRWAITHILNETQD